LVEGAESGRDVLRQLRGLRAGRCDPGRHGRFLSVRVWRAKLLAAVPWRMVTISPESTDSERA
jgi:hypothetical protein